MSVPKSSNRVTAVTKYLEEAKLKEVAWLHHAVQLLKKCHLECGDAVTWATYHASLADGSTIEPVISQLMPVFYERQLRDDSAAESYPVSEYWPNSCNCI